jgi:hypothetical protein
MDFFDAYKLRKASTGKYLLCRWAIENREKLASWSADTLSSRMQLVLTDNKATPLTASHASHIHIGKVRPRPLTRSGFTCI